MFHGEINESTCDETAEEAVKALKLKMLFYLMWITFSRVHTSVDKTGNEKGGSD